jgi:group I intron endonuclease
MKILQKPTTEEEFLAQREYRLKLLFNCGIYAIKNKINGKMYIGSSYNIKQRFTAHKSALKNNNHRNKHLQNAWNKYGEDNFEFIIIEHSSYPERILKRENINIKLFDPEYNNIKVNNENKFYHSDETKKKIGLKSKEKYIKNPKLKEDFINRLKNRIPWNKGKVGTMSEENRKLCSERMKRIGPVRHSQEVINKIAEKNKRPILQYDLEGNFIKEWDSSSSAAKFYNAKGTGNFSKATKEGIKLYNSYWKKK